MHEKHKLEALARMVAAEIDGAQEKPKLRLVARDELARLVQAKAAAGMDAITRDSHLRMIRQLRKSYQGLGFELLVAQATLGKIGVEGLNDDELIALHRDLDRARECIRDNVTFEEAGLVRAGTVS